MISEAMGICEVISENESSEKAKDSTLENISDVGRIIKSTAETENGNRKERFQLWL
jgi:hypothetical protein